MKKEFTFSGFYGMAVINGILTPIKATSVTMDAKGHFHYKTDKGEFTDIVLYEGQKDFEMNMPKELSVRLRSNNIQFLDMEDGSLNMKVWRMVDGEPKEECVDTAKKLIEEIGTGLVICSNKSLNYLRDGKSENILAINEFVRNYKN